MRAASSPIGTAGEIAESAELSAPQRAIVEAPASDKSLILAGPGAGKTHVLVARMNALASDEDYGAGDEILVLSFTRAVVAELRRRSRAVAGASRVVRPMTFDSFATSLLANTPGLDDSWTRKSYDGRIEAAARAVREDTETRRIVRRFKHIFVDEIQDLVSVRAEFVLEVLRHVPGGFTLLGDPAQAIYGFQLRKEGGLSPEAMLAKLRREYRPALKEYRLDENHRARSPMARRAAAAGATIRGAEPNYASAETELRSVTLDAVPLRNVDAIVATLRGVRAPTAILTRTNETALRISRDLYRAGIDHRFQREATERAVPAWLALAVAGRRYKDFGAAQFETRLDELRAAGDPVPPADLAWQLIRRAVPGTEDQVDLGRLADRVRVGLVPDELVDLPPCPLVVSTVHRAKGLEFDNVVIVSAPPITGQGSEEILEEIRVLYVALTRARDELFITPPLEAECWSRFEPAEDRWVLAQWGAKWKTLGFEVRGNDVDWIRPPGAWLLDVDPLETQRYLAEHVRRGDEIALELETIRKSDDPIPFYRVMHRGRPIGVTSEAFGELLSRRLRPKNRDARWPKGFTDVFVESIDTVAGMPGLAKQVGLGASDLWLRPRLIGLGRVEWYGGARRD